MHGKTPDAQLQLVQLIHLFSYSS